MRNIVLLYFIILIIFIINGCITFGNSAESDYDNRQNRKIQQWVETEPSIGDSITVVVKDSTVISGVYVGVVASIELNSDSLKSVDKKKSLLYSLKIIIQSDSTKNSIDTANIREVIIKANGSAKHVYNWGDLGLGLDVILYKLLNSSHKKASGKIE